MLEPDQIHHNSILDMEIKEAERFNKMVSDENDRKIKEWNEYSEAELKKDPEIFIPMCTPGLDFRRKQVIGFRYVE